MFASLGDYFLLNFEICNNSVNSVYQKTAT